MNDSKQKFKENAKNMEAYEGYLPEDQKSKKQPKTKKMKPITYGIRLETGEDSVQEVISELRKASHTIDNFFSSIDITLDADGVQFDDILTAVAQEMAFRVPKLHAKESIQNTFSMSCNKFAVRLEGGIKFEVISTYEVVQNVARITATVGEITLFSPNNDLKLYLKNSDKWSKITY